MKCAMFQPGPLFRVRCGGQCCARSRAAIPAQAQILWLTLRAEEPLPDLEYRASGFDQSRSARRRQSHAWPTRSIFERRGLDARFALAAFDLASQRVDPESRAENHHGPTCAPAEMLAHAPITLAPAGAGRYCWSESINRSRRQVQERNLKSVAERPRSRRNHC